MPFLDFFRNIFGRGSIQEPPQNRLEDDQQYRDSFRNPIWQSDEDEDEVNDFSNRPFHPLSRYQFRIFSDPFEMTRFFETQMDDMMRTFFGGFNGFGGFGNDRNVFGPSGSEDFLNALPIPEEKFSGKGPLDEVLKPESRFDDLLPLPDRRSSGKRLCDEVLKPSYEMPDSNSKKLDSDIDGKIQSDDLAKIWTTPSTSKDVQTLIPQSPIRSFGSSVFTQIVRRPDGSVEKRRTVKDSNGNEEVTVKRQIGDKIHTVITKKAKDGSEEKTEDIVNMDENELKGFESKWLKDRIAPKQDCDPSNDFSWYKFFGPTPKL